MAARSGPAVRDVLAGDEVAEVLRETFFAPDVPISESVGERTRVRRKPSAQTAIAGPVTTRARAGAARMKPIWAPSRPWALSHRPM